MQKPPLFKKIIFANMFVFVTVFLIFTCFTIVKAYRDNYKIAEDEAETNLRKSVASCLYHFKKSDFIELQRFVLSFTEINSLKEVLMLFTNDSQIITTNNFEYFNDNKEKIKNLLNGKAHNVRLGSYVFAVGEIEADSTVYGYAVYATRVEMRAAVIQQELVLFVFVVITLVLIIFTELVLVKKFTGPLKSLISSFLKNEFKQIGKNENDIQEIIELKDSYNFWVSEIDRYQKSLKEKMHWEAYSKIASQVAHDIRSPLAALDTVVGKTDQLPEKQRIMVRHAVNRIRDIANNLLEKNRQQGKAAPVSGSSSAAAGEPQETRLLSSLIEPVITEKRLQFESKSGINIDFELTRESYGLFAKIQPVEFRRIVSNLVNNAVEVLGDKGKVSIGLAQDEANIVVTVTDNGKGIPPDILAKLGQRGETHNKAGGSGLGLYHARTTVENWGGGLTIASEAGKGTTVTVKLPKVEAPETFVPVLELISDRPVVVLDDDVTIHQVWDGRFESARIKEHGIEVIHFSEPDKLRDWVKNNAAKAEKAVYLFDYELLGYKETGLSLAEELGICGKTISVTSRYEEKRIIEECKRLKIRMIPKGLASLVPITIQKSDAKPEAVPSFGQVDAVLVDDDKLARMNWEMAAEAKGVKLVIFDNPADFLARIGRFPKETPVYLDSELDDDEENGVKGENIAQDLHNKGYTDITLETGHLPEKFAHLPWLKVIDKTPPWS